MTRFSSLRVLGIALIAPALLVGVACGGDDDDGGTTAPTVATGGTSAPTTSGNASTSTEKQEVEILMKDNFFEPKEITVKAGSPVKIDTKNVGAAIHNMHILSQQGEGKDYSGDAMVNPGKDDDFEVTFTKKGTYKFQCDYHVPDMVGTITVN